MLLQVLITIGIAQALCLTALLLLKKQRSQADTLLAIHLIVLFCTTILFNYKEELNAFIPGIGLYSLALGYLALPLFFWYVVAASKDSLESLGQYRWIHFLPFVLVSVLLYSQYYTLPGAERLDLLCETGDGSLNKAWWQLTATYGLFLFMFPLYIALSFRVLTSHEAYILTRFSYTENVGLGWLNRFLWGVILMWIAFFVFEIIGGIWLGWIEQPQAFVPGFLAMVAMVIYLGIYGWQHQFFSLAQEEALEEAVDARMAEKYAGSGLTEDQKDQYLQKLLEFMAEEKPYLQPKVTIGQLAEVADIPVNYLSQIINEKLGQNFFEFINSYRVQTFQELAADPQNAQYTVLSLAFDAGFNSKSTFNAIFKKLTGQTPSEYVRLQAVGVVQKV